MFLLLVLLDVNPVSLQLDLDRRFQLQDILMDFKVCFLGMVADRRGDPGPCELGLMGSIVSLSSQAWGEDTTW